MKEKKTTEHVDKDIDKKQDKNGLSQNSQSQKKNTIAESALTVGLASDIDQQIAENLLYKKVTCKKILPNQLTNSREEVRIVVGNPKYHTNGVFKFGYTSFEVWTQPFNWRVTRRFKDFEWLRKVLSSRFSGCTVGFVLNRFLRLQARP